MRITDVLDLYLILKKWHCVWNVCLYVCMWMGMQMYVYYMKNNILNLFLLDF